MLIVKGIYDGNEIKLLEPVKIEGKHFVEIRVIEGELKKKQQLDAFKKARGIWKDRQNVDIVFEEIRERWQDWKKDLGESV